MQIYAETSFGITESAVHQPLIILSYFSLTNLRKCLCDWLTAFHNLDWSGGSSLGIRPWQLGENNYFKEGRQQQWHWKYLGAYHQWLILIMISKLLHNSFQMKTYHISCQLKVSISNRSCTMDSNWTFGI